MNEYSPFFHILFICIYRLEKLSQLVFFGSFFDAGKKDLPLLSLSLSLSHFVVFFGSFSTQEKRSTSSLSLFFENFLL
jgi:hypothetical protein